MYVKAFLQSKAKCVWRKMAQKVHGYVNAKTLR
jgi:hypothetical protein